MRQKMLLNFWQNLEFTIYNSSQKVGCDDEKKLALKYSGLDLVLVKVRNNLTHGVLEPTMSKVKSLKFVVEAAITILRIDDSIKLAK